MKKLNAVIASVLANVVVFGGLEIAARYLIQA